MERLAGFLFPPPRQGWPGKGSVVGRRLFSRGRGGSLVAVVHFFILLVEDAGPASLGASKASSRPQGNHHPEDHHHGYDGARDPFIPRHVLLLYFVQGFYLKNRESYLSLYALSQAWMEEEPGACNRRESWERWII